MNKISTLIYLVKHFQSDINAGQNSQQYNTSEKFLTDLESPAASPSETTINNILNFARSYEVLKTEKTGYVEMNLN